MESRFFVTATDGTARSSSVPSTEDDALQVKYNSLLAQLHVKTAHIRHQEAQIEVLQRALANPTERSQKREWAEAKAAEAGVAKAEAEAPEQAVGTEDGPLPFPCELAPPAPAREQLKWRLPEVPTHAAGMIDGNGFVMQQLFDAAVEAGTLLVRSEAEAQEWEARALHSFPIATRYPCRRCPV